MKTKRKKHYLAPRIKGAQDLIEKVISFTATKKHVHLLESLDDME